MSNEVDRAVQDVLRARVMREGPPSPDDLSVESRVDGPVTVLLVMEDLFFRKLVRRQLEEAGYAVTEASSVDRALARLRPPPPGLVLLDTWIDRGSGMLVLEALRTHEDHRDIPVLLLGNDTRPEVRARAAELGALGPVPIHRTVGVELWVDAALFGTHSDG